MIPVDVKAKNEPTIGIVDGQLELAINDDGSVLRSSPKRYYPFSGMVLSDITPIIVSDKIVLILEAFCETLPGSYQYGHFEFVLTYNSKFVSDGAKESDVLYRFESYKQDGWFIEYNNVYNFPGSGYQSSHALLKLRVKKLAWDLDLDLSKTLYLFSRVRGAYIKGDLMLSDVYGNWSGRKLPLYSSTFSNIGEQQYCPIAINLLPEITGYFSHWPAGKRVHYQVYIGESGVLSKYTSGSVKPLLFRDSSSCPTGFYFFDGSDVKTFDDDGIPSEYCGNKMLLVTSPLDTKKALFAVYRAFWAGGGTNWIAQAIEPFDMVTSSPREYRPSARFRFEAGAFPGNYHLHVIIGTSPNLSEYFENGQINNFSMIRYSYDGLLDYSTTLRVSDRFRFLYYHDGQMISPGKFGIDPDNTADVLYTSAQNYSDDGKLFVFYRVEYGLWSSSSSCSCSSSTSTSSESVSFSSNSSCSCSSCSSALHDGYYVNDAGKQEVNSLYCPNGTMNDGKFVYFDQSFTYALVSVGSVWYLSMANNYSSRFYANNTPSSTPPFSGWIPDVMGMLPPPVLSDWNCFVSSSSSCSSSSSSCSSSSCSSIVHECYYVHDAGIVDARGFYEEVGLHNSFPYYSNGGYYLFFSSGQWQISDSLDGDYYYSNPFITPDVGTWYASPIGTLPVPVVSDHYCNWSSSSSSCSCSSSSCSSSQSTTGHSFEVTQADLPSYKKGWYNRDGVYAGKTKYASQWPLGHYILWSPDYGNRWWLDFEYYNTSTDDPPPGDSGWVWMDWG